MTSDNGRPARRFRSRDWFDDPASHGPERALSRALHELRDHARRAALGQAHHRHRPDRQRPLALQPASTSSSPSACATASATPGGIPMEFPVHPIFENCRRPTAALDRNLAYLGLVEILHGYPIDAVVLTTGCDKTTPAAIMAASTVDIPAIVLSGGPMLDGCFEGELVGSGTVIWKSRRRLAAGQIDEEEFFETAAGLGAVGRPLQHHGHGLDHERRGRGARPVAARLRGHPRALPRARPDGLRDGAAHRRDGLRGPAPVEDPDARVLPERDRRDHGDRRLDQRPAAHHGHGAPRRRRDSSPPTGSTATTCRCSSTCSRRASTWASASTAPAACRPCCQRAAAGRQDRRRGR